MQQSKYEYKQIGDMVQWIYTFKLPKPSIKTRISRFLFGKPKISLPKSNRDYVSNCLEKGSLIKCDSCNSIYNKDDLRYNINGLTICKDCRG